MEITSKGSKMGEEQKKSLGRNLKTNRDTSKTQFCSINPIQPKTQTKSKCNFYNFVIFFISDVTVKYIRGLPHITVPLPSRNEKCQFTLKPVSHNVGDFLQMIKSEDRGIDRATILNNEGVRVSSGCTIENLMDDEFW